MPKKFSVLSWNVEHFKTDINRTKKIGDYVKKFDPDIFAIIETEDVDVMQLMQSVFTNYDFFITDGPELQEILVGCRRGVFSQKVFSQKREFKAYNPALRPGALLSVQRNNNWYSLLFLHTDSGTDAGAFGNRFEMMSKIKGMSNALQKANPGSGIIITGDLNTMGMNFPTSSQGNQKVNQDTEIQGIGKLLKNLNFSFAIKEYDATWISNDLSYNSNLDHVIHNDKVKLNKLGTRADQTPFSVNVHGWQQLSGADLRKYADTVSDHCMLYFEVA